MSATALPTMSYAGSAFICANRVSELSFWNAAASGPNAQEEGSTMQYLNEGSPLPICTLFPEFLLNFPVSGSAKMVYLEVLQRILMERRADDHGNYFAVSSIRELSELLSKSPATVKRAMAELEAKNLMERRRFSRGSRKKLYTLVPDSENP